MDQNPYLGRTVAGNSDQEAIQIMDEIIERKRLIEQLRNMNRQQRRAFLSRWRKTIKQQAKK